MSKQFTNIVVALTPGGIIKMKDEIIRLIKKIDDERLLNQIYEIIVHLM